MEDWVLLFVVDVSRKFSNSDSVEQKIVLFQIVSFATGMIQGATGNFAF
jgi:hypothetical protein